MTSEIAPAGLVLAAGAGRRFGAPKALVTLDKELFVDRAVRVLHDAGCDPVLVVLGAAATEVVNRARLERAVVLVNDGWSEGMGSSLRCGLSALSDLGAAGVVVLLVDQPAIGADAVRRLIPPWQAGARAVVASYDGNGRNPVLLDASTWSEVAASAQGDMGARMWLRAHPAVVVSVPCDDLGDPADIDTPADLTHLLEAST